MAITAATIGCTTDNDVVSYVDGLLVDYSAFDGCGWVLESSDGLLEPVNIFDTTFKINLTDSLKVRFAYVETDNQRSECRVGTVVKLIDIYSKEKSGE